MATFQAERNIEAQVTDQDRELVAVGDDFDAGYLHLALRHVEEGPIAEALDGLVLETGA